MSTISPNMSLVIPTIGVDSGLTWEQSVNINSGIVDGHNHSVGSGIQINPSGININADLPFNSFNGITLRSSRYAIQSSPLALPTDIGCVYVSGADLYYNDTIGNQVRMTSGGTVNATSSGITDGTATAAFSSGTLVVDSASNTPASIQGGTILLGNTGVSGSFYLSLSPPSSLSSNYTIVLPPLPGQTNVVTIDPSGNMGSITYDQVAVNMTSVGTNALITTMGSSGADTLAANRTRSSGSPTEGIGGVAISSSCGVFTTTSGTPVQVTNLTVTLTTSGRPVQITLIPDGSTTPTGNNSNIDVASTGALFFFNGSTQIAFYFLGSPTVSLTPMSMIDFPAAGTYTYHVFVQGSGTQDIQVSLLKLVAFEL